jgi:hypothetical protein
MVHMWRLSMDKEFLIIFGSGIITGWFIIAVTGALFVIF